MFAFLFKLVFEQICKSWNVLIKVINGLLPWFWISQFKVAQKRIGHPALSEADW